VVKFAGNYSKVKSVEDDGFEDVYCLSVPETGNFVGNGIVVKNCDALRYAVYTAFPQGEFNNPDEFLTIEQLKKKIYSDDGYGFMNPMQGGGYF